MVCIDCGRRAAGLSSYCTRCSGGHFHNTADPLAGFTSRFNHGPKPRFRSRADYDAQRHRKAGGLAWQRGPLRLMVWPFKLVWRVVQKLMRHIS